jgi:hypothetical protein
MLTFSVVIDKVVDSHARLRVVRGRVICHDSRGNSQAASDGREAAGKHPALGKLDRSSLSVEALHDLDRATPFCWRRSAREIVRPITQKKTFVIGAVVGFSF